MDASWRRSWSAAPKDIEVLIHHVRTGSGVAVWPNRWKMACFIHPAMYAFFKETASDFLGLRSPAGALVLSNTTKYKLLRLLKKTCLT